jgi:hypothetical protein
VTWKGFGAVAARKPLDEDVRGRLVATAEREVQNELRVALDSHECVGIADGLVGGFLRALVAFLLLDEAPDFISLNVLDRDVDNQPGHELFALLAGQNQQAEDGLAVNSGNPFSAANTGPFDQKPQDQFGFLSGQLHSIKRSLVGFSEGLAALMTAVALKAVPMLSETPAFVPAGVAGHL